MVTVLIIRYYNYAKHVYLKLFCSSGSLRFKKIIKDRNNKNKNSSVPVKMYCKKKRKTQIFVTREFNHYFNDQFQLYMQIIIIYIIRSPRGNSSNSGLYAVIYGPTCLEYRCWSGSSKKCHRKKAKRQRYGVDHTALNK